MHYDTKINAIFVDIIIGCKKGSRVKQCRID